MTVARKPSAGRPRRATRLDKLLARGLRQLERPEAPYLLLLAGLVLAGAALRLDNLGVQSLWFDEADVVTQSRAGLGALLRNFVTAGQNGPLYVLFLHAWTAVFGIGEVAVRLPSALAGIATIPLIYLLGRALHGPKLGLAAALVMAVAPYQTWYGQEAKMYALVVLAAVATTLLFLRALRTDRPADWVAYAVATTVGLYLHVAMALILLAQAAYFALVRGARPRRRGWLTFAILLLPYLPVGLWEARFLVNGATTWHRPIDLRDYLGVTFTKFAVNRAGDAAQARGLWLFAALALLGALPLAGRRARWPWPALPPRRRTLLLVLLVALPLVLFYAVTLVRPLYSDRYLIAVTPAFALLVAGGVLALERLWRPLALVALAAILATSWVPLREVNLSTEPQKEQWRDAYAHIAAHLHPDDLVIVEPGYLDTTLAYYRLRQPAGSRLRDVPLLTIPDEYTDGARDNHDLDLYLQQHTATFERVWVVLSTSEDRLAAVDPHDQLRGWYTYNGRLIDERQYNGVWVGLYTYRGPFGAPFYPPAPARLGVTYANGVALTGYDFDYYPDQGAVRPGDHIPLILRWVFPNPKIGRFAIAWRLTAADGAVVASGREPLLGGKPLRDWERPTEVWDYHDLPVPASLAPGQYRLSVVCVPADRPDAPLPATQGGQPLAGGVVPLGWVTVER
ncbi:MAG TPA: glycosyltransferase family 39 protein [Thermomicrobiales bacterium]|nr:glycosyltransferase family 39 protein [Thermomicrobiales bacterium]